MNGGIADNHVVVVELKVAAEGVRVCDENRTHKKNGGDKSADRLLRPS